MSTKQRVKNLIDAGSRPVLDTKNKQFLMLRGAGQKKTRLTNMDGTPTKAGLFWQELTGEQLPENSQLAVREGNVEFVKSGGKKSITRRLNVTNGEWVFTKFGLKYYKKLRRN